MSLEMTPYTYPLGFAAAVGLGLFAITATQLGAKGAYTLLGLYASITVWSASYALELASTVEGQALFWNSVRFFGPAFVVVAFVVLALQYTDREGVATRRTVAMLSVVPIVTTLLVWTDYAGVHDLVRTQAEMVTAEGVTYLELAFGPWYYVHALYSFGLAFVALGLFTEHLRHVEGVAFQRTAVILVGGFPPVLGTLLFTADLTAIDWGPVGYVLTGLAWILVIFYY